MPPDSPTPSAARLPDVCMPNCEILRRRGSCSDKQSARCDVVIDSHRGRYLKARARVASFS